MVQVRVLAASAVLGIFAACGLPLGDGSDPDSESPAIGGSLQVSGARYQEEPAAFAFDLNEVPQGVFRVQRCLPDEGCLDQFFIRCAAGGSCSAQDARTLTDPRKNPVSVLPVGDSWRVTATVCRYTLRGQPAQARFQLVSPSGQAVYMRRDWIADASRCESSGLMLWLEFE